MSSGWWLRLWVSVWALGVTGTEVGGSSWSLLRRRPSVCVVACCPSASTVLFSFSLCDGLLVQPSCRFVYRVAATPRWSAERRSRVRI